MTNDVAFISCVDGTEQRYVIVLHEPFDAQLEHDVLVVLHGHGADRWQFVSDPRDECRAARDAAAEHRMIYLSPDYRARTSWMGSKAEADLVQIVAEIKDRYRVSRFILCGASMGGAASLTFAALHPELVDGVVSMNGTANLLEYESFLDAIAESFGGTKGEIPHEYRNRSAEYRPDRLTMTLAITASADDAVVPPASLVRLVGLLRDMGRDPLFIFREHAGHQTNYDDAREALQFVIRRSGSAGGP